MKQIWKYVCVAALAVPAAAGAQPAPPAPARPAPAQPAPPASAPGPAPAPVAPPAPAPVAPPAPIAPAGSSPAGRELSLGQALEVAVRQKPSLALAAIDVSVAEAALLQAQAVDDWVLSAALAWSSIRYQVLNRDQDRIAAQAAAARSLSTGGTVSLGLESGFTSAIEDTYDHTVSVSLSQPLLRGRGEKVARAATRQARLALSAAQLARRSEAITAVRQVVAAYFELAYSQRSRDIRKNSLELALERLRNTQAGITAGAVAPIEALAVEGAIASRNEEILLAELDITNQSLQLRRLVGLEIGPGEIELHATVPLAVTPRQLDMHALLARAYEQSPELAMVERRRESAAIDVQVTDNGLLPRLDAALSIGPIGVADDPGEALANMATFGDLTFNATLSGSYEVGRRAARGANRRARAQLLQQTVTSQDIKAQIASALALAVKQSQIAAGRLELTRRAVALAEQNIAAEQARFELGRATNFDVLQRQDELRQAQLREARAVLDYMQAESAIEAITGDILPRYGITLSE